MATGLACLSCGTGLRPNAKFCDECGASTAIPDRTAKYKQVTVLFADVVRSMDIAAALDLERFREIMTDVLGRSAALVQRYGGGIVEYTGDGVMALFGAPLALEDHALRACLAALAIQEEAARLAAEVHDGDSVALKLRVGLNSGRVIAGDVGSGAPRYAATGETLGIAQRMESAAPPGGVMLSEATARLVERRTVLAEPEWLRVKGRDDVVCARRLVAMSAREKIGRHVETNLVGRRWEIATVEAMVEQSIAGRGAVLNVVGPPGIGKSRVARESAVLATARDVEVQWVYCESHTRDVPFGAVAQLLRAATGAVDLGSSAARVRVRKLFPQATPEDILLLDDLLGIAQPDRALPQIDPDARRRRLTALVTTAMLARSKPAMYVIEDAHWIDRVSESMLSEFLTVIPHSKVMVLITSRPEYEGTLTRFPEAQTIALAPLSTSDATAMLWQLLGTHPSVSELTTAVATRAAGNPFFAEEMVRELAQRRVLTGHYGAYVSCTDVAEVSVPATVQAAIEARIDRLAAPARQTLDAASVIGARFGAEMLTMLGIVPSFDELLRVELVDQVRSTPHHRIRVPASAHPRGRLRSAAELGPRPMASPPGRGHRVDGSRVSRPQCGADR